MARPGITSGWRVGRIFGIMICVHPGWLIICFLLVYTLGAVVLPGSDLAGGGAWWKGAEIAAYARGAPGRLPGQDWPEWHYWVLAVVGTIGLFGCVLAHELSHSVVARANGISVESITLFIFGGVARLRDEPRTPGIEFKVALAGPLMSLVLGGFCWGLYVGLGEVLPEQSRSLLFYLGFVNVALALFNLLPGFPMDGGRILRAALWKCLGNLKRATFFASMLGKMLGGGMIALGGVLFVWMLIFTHGQSPSIGSLWMIFIGLFLWNAAGASYRQVVLREAFAGLTVRHLMRREVAWVDADLTLDRLVAEYVYHHRLRSFPVVEDGSVVGSVALKDVQAVSRATWPKVRVRDVVRRGRNLETVAPDEDLLDVFRRMIDRNREYVLVADAGGFDGIVLRDDVMTLVQVSSAAADGTAGAEDAPAAEDDARPPQRNAPC